MSVCSVRLSNQDRLPTFIPKLTSFSVNEIIASIYVLVLMTLYLWYCGEDGYNDIGNAKDSLFFIIHICFIVCMLCSHFLSFVKSKHISDDIVKNIKCNKVVIILVLLYLLLVWFADLQSQYWPEIFNNQDTFNECTLTLTIYCVCFLFVLLYFPATSLMVSIFGISISLYCILCLLQMQDLNPLGLYRNGSLYGLMDGLYWQGQFIGTLGNSDFSSGFLAVCAVLFVALLFRCDCKYRTLLLVPIVLSFVTLIRMMVYIGIVSLILSVVIFIVVAAPMSTKIRKYIGVTVLFSIVTALLILYTIDLPHVEDANSYSVNYNLLEEVQQILHGNVKDSMGSHRIAIWKQVLAAIPARLFRGYGSGAMQWGEFKTFSRYSVEQGGLVYATPDVAHNIYLEILYSHGIITLLIVCIFLFYILYIGVRNASHSIMAAVTVSGVFCWVIQAFFNISTSITSPYFLFLFSLLCKAINVEYGVKRSVIL